MTALSLQASGPQAQFTTNGMSTGMYLKMKGATIVTTATLRCRKISGRLLSHSFVPEIPRSFILLMSYSDRTPPQSCRCELISVSSICCRPGGALKPPVRLDSPLLMIGPGTGVAPFLGFLQQRHAAMQATAASSAGPAWLFFGCRQPQEDFLFQQELQVSHASSEQLASNVW